MKTLNLYSKGFRPKNILTKKILSARRLHPAASSPRTLHPSRKPRFQGSAPPPHCSATPSGRPSTTAHEHSGRKIFTQVVISLPASFLNLPTSFFYKKLAEFFVVYFIFCIFFALTIQEQKYAKRIKIHHETL